MTMGRGGIYGYPPTERSWEKHLLERLGLLDGGSAQLGGLLGVAQKDGEVMMRDELDNWTPDARKKGLLGRPASKISMKGEWEDKFPDMDQGSGEKAKFLGVDGDRWGAMLTRLPAAAAFAYGDFNSGAKLSKQADEQLADSMKRQRITAALRNAGYSDTQIELAMTNPKALGTNYNQRFGTRSVADGTSVVTGGPDGPETAFYRPKTTDFQRYANTLGHEPGTADYGAAVQDYVLRGNGPTAMGFDKQIDDHRTDNRRGLETQRQNNRKTLRSTPTYRDLNGAPSRSAPRKPKVPTATGANGEKIYFKNKRWVDGMGRVVQ